MPYNYENMSILHSSWITGTIRLISKPLNSSWILFYMNIGKYASHFVINTKTKRKLMFYKNTLSIFYSKIPSNYVKVSITYCAMLRLVTNLVEPRYRHFLMATTYPPNWICTYLIPNSNIEKC